ncbi:MAG: glycoside hydrolase family 130 protein [Bacteroidia bacterium]
MVEIIKEGILLTRTSLTFENEAVCNPAVIREGNKVHIFYRAISEGNYSTLGYCRLDGPLKIEVRAERPVIFPEFDFEKQGVEDPRIVKIEDTYYLTYSAYDGANVGGVVAKSKDLIHFEKTGIITPIMTYEQFFRLATSVNVLNEKYFQHYKIFKEHGLQDDLAETMLLWDKNLVLFPRKINGQFALLHRIFPGVQLVMFDKFEDLTQQFWENYIIDLPKYIVLDPVYNHENAHLGGGCPPIETEDGWLFIYHTTEDSVEGLIYHAAAALLDLDNPYRVIARLPMPLISPQLDYEIEGLVKDVVFPSGTAIFDDDLYIYYGASDTTVAVARLKWRELLAELKKFPVVFE